MRFSWPAPASALLLLGAVGAHGAAAPSLSLQAYPSLLSADGATVAAVVPGNRRGRCAEIVLWRAGHAPVRIKTYDQCDTDGIGLDRVVSVALAGRTVLFQETNGGNNLEMIVSTATLAHPTPNQVSYVENGGGAASDPAGDYNGDVVGHGGLLAYATWKRCDGVGGGYARPCAAGQAEVYDQKLVVGRRVVLTGPDALHAIWTDGSSILVRHADGTLLLLRSNGHVVHRFAAIPGLAGAVFQGSQLVTLTPTALAVWNVTSGRRIRAFALRPGRRVLEDVDGGIAVLGASGTTHLIRLSDGRGETFADAAHAQLEPQGLYFSSGSQLRFVPRTALRFG